MLRGLLISAELPKRKKREDHDFAVEILL